MEVKKEKSRLEIKRKYCKWRGEKQDWNKIYGHGMKLTKRLEDINKPPCISHRDCPPRTSD